MVVANTNEFPAADIRLGNSPFYNCYCSLANISPYDVSNIVGELFFSSISNLKQRKIIVNVKHRYRKNELNIYEWRKQYKIQRSSIHSSMKLYANELVLSFRLRTVLTSFTKIKTINIPPAEQVTISQRCPGPVIIYLFKTSSGNFRCFMNAFYDVYVARILFYCARTIVFWSRLKEIRMRQTETRLYNLYRRMKLCSSQSKYASFSQRQSAFIFNCSAIKTDQAH